MDLLDLLCIQEQFSMDAKLFSGTNICQKDFVLKSEPALAAINCTVTIINHRVP